MKKTFVALPMNDEKSPLLIKKTNQQSRLNVFEAASAGIQISYL